MLPRPDPPRRVKKKRPSHVGDTKTDLHYKPRRAGHGRIAGPPTPRRAGVGNIAGPPTPKRAGVGKIAGPPTPVKRVKKKEKKHKQGRGVSNLNFATATIPTKAIVEHKQDVARYGGNIAENAVREAVTIPAELVPGLIHIAKPAYKDPGSPKAYVKSAKRAGEAAISLPKEYIEAGKKKGLKGVGETFVKHPLSTGLTVAPVPRLPGLAAGKVATRAGKMPKVEPRTLPGTAMKETVPRSKSYFKAKRQAKKKGLGVTDKHIDTRIDAQVALKEDLARRAQQTTYKKAYKARKKVVSKKQARYEAKDLALKEQAKIRNQIEANIVKGMALRSKPKVDIHHKIVKPADTILFNNHAKANEAADLWNKKSKVQFQPYKTQGGFAIAPKSMVKRLEHHSANTEVGVAGAAGKLYSSVWRKNVLATHPTWYVGNLLEAGVRSAVEGVGPMSYVRGYKALNELKRTDPAAWAEATGHMTKGGHLTMQAHLPEETKIAITGHTKAADMARHLQALRDKPGIREIGDGWNTVTDFTMGTLSGKAESFFQTGMLGKELSRNPLMDEHVFKTSKAAIADAANGLRKTHNQIALGQAIDRMYGQYGKFSPTMRRRIANYTPFIAWTMNSLKWLYHYLPRDHPVLTAAVASSQPFVEEWLKDKGLSPFVKGALPSFLQGSIPTEGGTHARFPTRYTPFAVAAGFPEDLAGTILPQFSGSIDIARHGINWKGQKLENPDKTPLDPWQKVILAGITQLEGFIPASQQFIDPASHYEKGARTVKTLAKPRSGEEIAKAFNPFSRVQAAKNKSEKPGSLYSPSKTKVKSLYDEPSKKQKSLYDSP